MSEPPKTAMKSLHDNFEISAEKVLGMWWCHEIDVFTYKIRIHRLNQHILVGKRRPTKREVLLTLMSVFDPLGFLAAFLVYVKMLLREIWRTKIGWDDAIHDDHYEKWLLWVKMLSKIEEVRIPRCYRTKTLSDSIKSTQLHIFVDASEYSYAAVAYLRIASDERVDVALVGAKTKVAPQSPLSIPRMELQAAVLGCRLALTICRSHSMTINQRVFWSDSKTVLCWLQADPRRFHQFVSLRVGEILDSTNVSEWRWISTTQNIADEATKWKVVPDLSPDGRWFAGPQFLRLQESQWSNESHQTCDTLEELRIHLVHSATSEKPITAEVGRFDNWRRLQRSQAYVLRAVQNLKAKSNKTLRVTGPISSDEYKLAEECLFRKCQSDSFAEEINTIRRNLLLPEHQQVALKGSSVLRTVSPYLDENGILRIEGRIDASNDVTEEIKHPIVLPRDHQITKLIVSWYHRRFHHHNHETVINELRQKFHISRIRQTVKTVRASCQRCKNSRAAPKPPRMSNLPVSRLSAYTRPFTYCGIDYFGPMMVTMGRRTEKRWGVLITCLTVRAVHIEIAHSLNTDSCIMCLRNFMSRRGTPRILFCDNGTNFHGADNELRKSLEDVNFEKLQTEFESASLKWVFNPPAAPHMGGSWERLVGSVKKVLLEIMPKRNPTDEVLRSLLMEAENVVNSRPLTHVSVEPNDLEALTPNHFLLGSSNGTSPPGQFGESDLILRKNWRKSQQLADQFWKRWVREYLPTITRREKWFDPVKPIETGDIVLIADENLQRNYWPKGVVVSTKISSDGQVRSATIQTKSGILTRPAVKIAVLDVLHKDKPIKSLDLPGGVSYFHSTG